MPLSAFFSRRNDKKQLRTDRRAIEHYLCCSTAKKLIGPIIIKKPAIRKMRYIAMQGTCQCHLAISFPAGMARNN
ncbi:hypothetical protein ES703_68551 [subsurface metagenome]